ncbi:MAG TPA: FkbM family methyltransferase [Acidimicrobiales bacterium]|nr:FkbM family methyltransferase [Acidimicrobiales bacterium]
MAHPYLSRAVSRFRSRLGLEDMERRLSSMGSQLDDLAVQLTRIESSPTWPAYLGDHTAIFRTQWGGILLVDTRESVLAPALLLFGVWEPSVTAWFQSALKEGQTFVDIGANIGYYSVLGGRLTGPSGRVVAIEAHPRMVALLRRNKVVNGLGNMTIWEKAAWAGDTKLEFHVRSDFAANSSVGAMSRAALDDLGDTEDVMEVDGIAVDELVADLDRVDLVKVDVEGAEVQVMKGLLRTFARNPGMTLMFEWSPGQLRMVGDDPDELLDILEGLGFRFRMLESPMETIDRRQLLAVHHGNVVATRSQRSQDLERRQVTETPTAGP